MLNIFQTSSNNSTALRMQNRGVVSIFGAGYPGCDLAALKEDLERAERYIPLARKYAIAQVLAPGCIERGEGAPPVWRENIVGRKLVELYILTGFYLYITDTSGLDQEAPIFQFTLEDYDRLSGVLRDLAALEEAKAADILTDLDEFLDILNRQISNTLAQRNDMLARFQELTSAGFTPETFQELQKALEEAKAGEAE